MRSEQDILERLLMARNYDNTDDLSNAPVGHVEGHQYLSSKIQDRIAELDDNIADYEKDLKERELAHLNEFD